MKRLEDGAGELVRVSLKTAYCSEDNTIARQACLYTKSRQ